MRNKLRTLLLTAALAAAILPLAPAQTHAQTNTNNFSEFGPAGRALDFLSSGSTNWLLAPYAILSSDNKSGMGLAAGYRLNDFVIPTLRLDYFDGTVWMPSASLQLQAPLTLGGKFTCIPFGFAGVATPIAGKGSLNGTAQSIIGAGIAIRLDVLGSGTFWQHLDLVADVEHWSGFTGQQDRFGFLWKF